MSRPFSYHDEHLDVIGNILFVHSYIPHSTWPGVPMFKSTTRGFETYN